MFLQLHLCCLDSLERDPIVRATSQSINQNQSNLFPHIDNQVQHIQKELMWEMGKLKRNTYNTLSPFMK